MSSNKIDWIIHLVANGACDACGKEETGFLSYTCNAHTHGMERYGHPDFQIVLSLPPREIGRILNTLGRRVQDGERFCHGRYVSGIYARRSDSFATKRNLVEILRFTLFSRHVVFDGEGDKLRNKRIENIKDIL